MERFGERYYLRSASRTDAMALLERASISGQVSGENEYWTSFAIEGTMGEVNPAIVQANTGVLLFLVYAEESGWQLDTFHGSSHHSSISVSMAPESPTLESSGLRSLRDIRQMAGFEDVEPNIEAIASATTVKKSAQLLKKLLKLRRLPTNTLGTIGPTSVAEPKATESSRVSAGLNPEHLFPEWLFGSRRSVASQLRKLIRCAWKTGRWEFDRTRLVAIDSRPSNIFLDGCPGFLPQDAEVWRPYLLPELIREHLMRAGVTALDDASHEGAVFSGMSELWFAVGMLNKGGWTAFTGPDRRGSYERLFAGFLRWIPDIQQLSPRFRTIMDALGQRSSYPSWNLAVIYAARDSGRWMHSERILEKPNLIQALTDDGVIELRGDQYIVANTE